jgi:hypothetical protein
VILVVVVVAVWVILLTTATVIATGRPRRGAELEKRFGPQWARTVEAQRSGKGAEADLHRRIARRLRLQIRPLSGVEARRYQRDWQGIQASFVDMPDVSLRQADGLVTEVMRERGSTTDDFDDQAELISVEHPEIVEHYRRAHSVIVASQRRQASI